MLLLLLQEYARGAHPLLITKPAAPRAEATADIPAKFSLPRARAPRWIEGEGLLCHRYLMSPPLPLRSFTCATNAGTRAIVCCGERRGMSKTWKKKKKSDEDESCFLLSFFSPSQFTQFRPLFFPHPFFILGCSVWSCSSLQW